MLLNVAAVPGMMMIDCAKMIGITPAELMRSGMKLFCPSRTRPRPITLRGICTGILRAAMVMAATPATTTTITRSMMTANQLITPVVTCSHVVTSAPGKPWMIEKKISSDMPLPMPRSVICSPSHITNTAPIVRISVVEIRKKKPRAHDRRRAGRVQALQEHGVAVALHERQHDGGVARPLRQLLAAVLAFLLHLLDGREDGGQQLEHDAGGDVRHDAEREHRRARQRAADEQVVDAEQRALVLAERASSATKSTPGTVMCAPTR
jgi:hypothetical protein